MDILFSRLTWSVLMLLLVALPEASAQDALKPDVKKPEKFENKKLGYEKTEEKKFSAPRRFFQNTFTHYNYFFNANNKLNEAIARVKSSHKDDFSTLLPFYNYSLEKTAAEKQELDSVIYKSTVGILIHDLRTNWVDNMYMLIGKAYYYRKELDSARITFQYVNYAFAPKEKDGYDKVIGSNSNEESNGLSISTKENNSITKKAFSRPPSRNEAFIWQIRTHLASDAMADAAGLIQTLRNDPQFPSRLLPELAEVQAHWFYKQQLFDSAAIYLAKALPVAENNNELSRWEYLIAQLYERSGHPDEAEKFYARAIKHTFDPVMEVHARLNSIRQNQSDNKDNIQQNINELLKMARKERYYNYRDVIYYTAAQMELERNDPAAAKALLIRSTKYSAENPDQRNKSFLLLADLSFREKDYQSAKSYYDSVNLSGLQDGVTAIANRKEALNFLVVPAGVIYRQDSLQRIAGLPDRDREAFVRKVLKQARRAQGLKEEEPLTGGQNNNLPGGNQPQASDLFTNAPKGEWYFNNASQKSKGFTEFRSKWGNRPNVDNWRRLAAVNTFANTKQNDNKIGDAPATAGNAAVQELSYDAFVSNLPLTPEKLKISNDSIENALMDLGRAYHGKLEDHEMTAQTLEKLLGKFPTTSHKQEALFLLYYSYYKLNDLTKANYYKIQLQQMFPASSYTKMLEPSAGASNPDSVLKRNATRSYESIYNSFIEGDFEKALADKRAADSAYGSKYWTPQLLYIESIYHVRQRNDSTAKAKLYMLMNAFPDSPLKGKAETMLNVLNRRAEIENYLTNLEVTRLEDSSVVVTDQPAQQPVAKVPPSQVLQPVTKTTEQPVTTRDPSAKKEDSANKKDSLAVVQKPVTDKTKDTIAVAQKPPAAVNKDAAAKAPAVIVRSTYSFKPEEPQLVMMVLDKVDPVYVTEARNAFNRFNREKFYNKTFEITNVPLDENIKLVIISNFENASAAIEYVERVRKVAPSEIIPWMPPGKYTFYIISAQNLEVLKSNRGIGEYIKELSSAFPGKF